MSGVRENLEGHERNRLTSATPEDVVDRILARSLGLEGTAIQQDAPHEENLEAEERAALRRVGLSTELEDITEVEYRQLRLEKVVLAGVYASDAEAAEVSLRELAALAETAGSEVLDGVLQRRAYPDPSTYLGSGKAKELAEIVHSVGADTVIMDADLAPSQRRALEDIVKVKVVDRTAVILDIFAQHAKSREGKAQVELAQLEYLLPRLRGWGESMSRQAGGRVAGGEGIGSRGPGETKIELDRRRIRNRMAKLRKQIAAMEPSRATKRARRESSALPQVAIVGYTNAGKSSLLNEITGADVMVQNQLFATLDPTVRRAQTPDGREFTIADTVGFVRSLPHELVEAFRSTLEEVGESDLIVHVVDAAHPDPEGQIKAVREVLEGIEGASDIPELLVFNKSDIAPLTTLQTLRTAYPRAVAVSAHTGAGIAELAEHIQEALPQPQTVVDVVVPYSRGDLVSRMHTFGQIDSEEHLAEGTRLVGRADADLASELARVSVA